MSRLDRVYTFAAADMWRTQVLWIVAGVTLSAVAVNVWQSNQIRELRERVEALEHTGYGQMPVDQMPPGKGPPTQAESIK